MADHTVLEMVISYNPTGTEQVPTDIHAGDKT
jgi:hypothetical protein